jgi:hypothetical protein
MSLTSKVFQNWLMRSNSLSSFTQKSQMYGRAGQKIHLSKGRGRSGNDEGPLRETPDWEFAGKSFY